MVKPKRKKRLGPSLERFAWRSVTMTATHTPDYISTGWSHIELRVVRPKRKPVPITDTGYLSYFLEEDELIAAGGAMAFFRAWLDREAGSKAYARALAAWAQLDLFENLR